MPIALLCKLLIRQFASTLIDLSRCRGETELIRTAKVLEHSEPITEARTVALVHYDEVELTWDPPWTPD